MRFFNYYIRTNLVWLAYNLNFYETKIQSIPYHDEILILLNDELLKVFVKVLNGMSEEDCISFKPEKTIPYVYYNR